MIDILGHEAFSAPFEVQHVSANMIPNDFDFTAVLDQGFLERRLKGSFRPAQLPEFVVPGFVKLEEVLVRESGDAWEQPVARSSEASS